MPWNLFGFSSINERRQSKRFEIYFQHFETFILNIEFVQPLSTHFKCYSIFREVIFFFRFAQKNQMKVDAESDKLFIYIELLFSQICLILQTWFAEKINKTKQLGAFVAQ